MKMNLPDRFNIRCYALIVVENHVLVSHERYGGLAFTKFPGGGLEFGEGTLDCIARELQEELGWEIKTVSHCYTTDFFQKSAFRKTDQLLSIYYYVQLKENPSISNKPQSLESNVNFEWVSLANLSSEMFRWPIDKLVVERGLVR